MYQLDGDKAEHGDNQPYRRTRRYQVTVIDRNPDNTLHDKVGEFPTSVFDRFFASDNLNHYVYNLFY